MSNGKELADVEFMQQALQLAAKAAEENEVPVGALIVQDGAVIGCGWNQSILGCDPTAHAEIQALRQAALANKNFRLPDTTLYVTLEPCAMCVGAMLHARIKRLVFGAREPKAGAVVSHLGLLDMTHWNHSVEYQEGVLAEQSSELMSAFFKQRRAKKKALKQAANENFGELPNLK